jgi:hypothetical protein
MSFPDHNLFLNQLLNQDKILMTDANLFITNAAKDLLSMMKKQQTGETLLITSVNLKIMKSQKTGGGTDTPHWMLPKKEQLIKSLLSQKPKLRLDLLVHSNHTIVKNNIEEE